MGSKRSMLSNGLGDILRATDFGSRRFVDLFCGSSVVSWYVAEQLAVEVVAVDLQKFAVDLADAVISRSHCVETEQLWTKWSLRAQEYRDSQVIRKDADQFACSNWEANPANAVARAVDICQQAGALPITRSYGGYYFSPSQALTIDALRATLPEEDGAERKLALAALIQATSECAAAPGHTAQPFKPTPNGAKYLFNAWKRDALTRTSRALTVLNAKIALKPGRAVRANALEYVGNLSEHDVAFVDPPYSGVQYSRFYHVLETVAVGTCSTVEGAGRYPPRSERPQSDFSMVTRSRSALEQLLHDLAERRVRTIVTFPQAEASNGLSGTSVEELASQHFKVTKTAINGHFSTLGGNQVGRSARIPAYELVLVLDPP